MSIFQFEINIPKEPFNAFVEKSPYCNLLQSYQWASVKDNWDHLYTGVYDEKRQLVAAGLVLIKQLPMKFTMFYLPRGPILDYSNERLLQYYFQELKRIAKKRHCLFIKFDPEIHMRDYVFGDVVPKYNDESMKILNNIKKMGALHHGFTTYIEETAQPRFHMGVQKCDDMNKHVPRATLRSKNVAIRKHVEVELVDEKGLDAFARVMHMTEERKNVQLRNEAYFKKLMDAYPDTSYLFLAHVNPMTRACELKSIISENENKLKDESLGKKAYRKVNQTLNQARQELDSMHDILEKYNHEEIIAGGLMVGFGKTCEMLYAGMNNDFRNFRPQYLTYMTQFSYAFSHGYDYVTMGGVEGTLDDGLSVYKANFNPIVNEFIGEFDLPVNKLLFQVSEKAYAKMKGKAKNKK